tara:strand:- start:3248 stop:4519 length:1272 start_codon:yes stop_codon:yes gene_type:complete
MKKVLIVTYYWPPAGGPGVQRWLKFVKYLPEFGVLPYVYVPENPHYPIQDPSLLDEIPEGLTVFRHPIFEPYRAANIISSKKTKRISSGIIQTKDQSILEKLMLWVRGNFFIPDARKYWVKPSVAYLTDVIKNEGIDTIITTGPPHSVHIIGQRLKEQLDLNWIADFRDPWTSIGYHKKLHLTKTAQKKHRQLERDVLTNADKILVTSRTTKQEFENLTEKPITVITNGFDTNYKGNAYLDENFTIAHIGSLLTGRNPKNLWKALAELAAENVSFRSDLQLEFVGVVSQEVMDSLSRYELAPYVKLRGYVSHTVAVRRQQSAQVLLLVEIDSEETRGIIPGKLFEYMAAKRPILGIGPEHWEAGKIILESQTGAAFDHSVQPEIKNILLEWYTAFKQGNLHIAPNDIQKYSRKSLTEQLAKQI